MLNEQKVKIIMKEINKQAGLIPAYVEKYYKNAILEALTKIEKQESKEHNMYV